jgi:tetratricopeptide (TPR) repeat protein
VKPLLLAVCLLPLVEAVAFAGDELDDPTAAPDGGMPAAPTGPDREGASRLAQKALARIKEGAWEEAATLLRRAHARDPKNAGIATDWGFALAHLGRRDEAERAYRTAVEIDPGRFYAYVNLAELWSSDPTRWQRGDEMLAFLEKAVITVGSDARARAHVELRLAELLRSLGRADEARTHLQRLTEPTVPAQVRRRASKLAQGVDAEARDRALVDWPAPAVPAADGARLEQARTQKDPRAALPILDALLARWPAWADARWERARALERVGQLDEASADLTIVVQLSPSHAHAWRRLGMLLAQHGGRLEAERADEALRHALALEPSWADLRELRQQVAAKRARGTRQAPGERVPEPTAKARQLLQDALSWMGMEAPEMAPPLLQQALAESPGFVEAAASLYAIEHTMPEATIRALWNDGEGLWRLAVAVGALRSREAATLARPWIDRAVELDVQEARFARASLRAAAGDRAGALEDLRDYVAAEPLPPRLEEARALRMTLGEPATVESPERLAHLRLAADRPQEALAALGGSCRPGLPGDSLLALGRVHEYSGDAHSALRCYQQAIDGATDVPERLRQAQERLAAAATALPPVELTRFQSSLEAAAQARIALAAFSLARMAEARRQWPEAAAQTAAFIARAGPDEPRLAEARALQARVGRALTDEAERRNVRAERLRVAAALAVLAALGLFGLHRRYRQSLARALRSQPLLFPALAKAVGQVRHDVLKHRASALELLFDPGTNRDDVARALLEPTPASAEVASIYQHLAQDARGLGVRLCDLRSEPVFGPLAADLDRAETLVKRPDHDADARVALYTIDQRLRGEHSDRLQRLLLAGPRTLLNAGLLVRWIEGVGAEPSRTHSTAPGLSLQEAQTAFPLPRATLCSIVSNLLRNALDATAGETGAAVQLRVEQGRDGTDRRAVSVLVADSSMRRLDSETIESRPADRGLGIVRETARAWGGEMVLREEAAPFRKSVGVRFPAPPEAPV